MSVMPYDHELKIWILDPGAYRADTLDSFLNDDIESMINEGNSLRGATVCRTYSGDSPGKDHFNALDEVKKNLEDIRFILAHIAPHAGSDRKRRLERFKERIDEYLSDDRFKKFYLDLKKIKDLEGELFSQLNDIFDLDGGEALIKDFGIKIDKLRYPLGESALHDHSSILQMVKMHDDAKEVIDEVRKKLSNIRSALDIDNLFCQVSSQWDRIKEIHTAASPLECFLIISPVKDELVRRNIINHPLLNEYLSIVSRSDDGHYASQTRQITRLSAYHTFFQNNQVEPGNSYVHYAYEIFNQLVNIKNADSTGWGNKIKWNAIGGKDKVKDLLATEIAVIEKIYPKMIILDGIEFEKIPCDELRASLKRADFGNVRNIVTEWLGLNHLNFKNEYWGKLSEKFNKISSWDSAVGLISSMADGQPFVDCGLEIPDEPGGLIANLRKIMEEITAIETETLNAQTGWCLLARRIIVQYKRLVQEQIKKIYEVIDFIRIRLGVHAARESDVEYRLQNFNETKTFFGKKPFKELKDAIENALIEFPDDIKFQRFSSQYEITINNHLSREDDVYFPKKYCD